MEEQKWKKIFFWEENNSRELLEVPAAAQSEKATERMAKRGEGGKDRRCTRIILAPRSYNEPKATIIDRSLIK